MVLKVHCLTLLPSIGCEAVMEFLCHERAGSLLVIKDSRTKHRPTIVRSNVGYRCRPRSSAEILVTLGEGALTISRRRK